MPFKSQQQRKLFWAAKSNANLRKKLGVSKKMVEKMTSHDEGGSLPKKTYESTKGR